MKPIKLDKNEIINMADVMSDAFLLHSNWVTRIPIEVKRKKLMNNLFIILFNVINKYGYIFEVLQDNKKVGYITYMDPTDKEQISLRRIIKTKSFKYIFRFLFQLTPKIFKNMLDYMKVYNAHIIKDTKAIHLYSTGILLEYRGRGIMGKSLRDSFEYFFNNGFNKILLETSDESNIVIYQKLGFKITEVISKKKQSMYFLDLERVNDECI